MIAVKDAIPLASPQVKQATHSSPAKSSPALRLLLASITRGEREIGDRRQPEETASRQAEFGLD